MDGGVTGLDEFSEATAADVSRDDTPSAERATIACVLCDPDGRWSALDRMAVMVQPEDFADRRNAAVWSAFLAARARGGIVDGATAAEELTSQGMGAAVRYLGELAALNVNPAGCEDYARRVAERSYLRAVTARVRDALDRSRKPGAPLDVVSDVRAALAAIPDGVRGARDDSMRAAAIEAMESIESAALAAQNHQRVAASWGVLSLDGGDTDEGFVEGSLGGLFPGKLYVIGGVPAAGKTTLAWQATLATGKAGGHVLVFSLEMPRVEIMKRLAGQMCGIPESRIETGALFPEEIAALAHAMNELANHPVNIINDARTLEEIRARVLAEKARGDVALVVVDYLQLVKMAARYEDGNRADEDRVQGLKNLAMEGTGVPVLAISAMTKVAQREAAEGKVTSASAKGAGAEYAADLMAFLVRSDPDDKSPTPEVIFVMTKRRGGPISNTPLRFNMPRGRFEAGGSLW